MEPRQAIHEMLVRYGKEFLPQAHYVTELNDAIDGLYKYSRVIVSEFFPRGYQAQVVLNYKDLMASPSALIDMVSFQYQVAFASLREKINYDWNREVIPAETPSGE